MATSATDSANKTNPSPPIARAFYLETEMTIEIEWTSTSTPPAERKDYLCAVETDSGAETHVLHWDGRGWLHECEYTFQHGYMFSPYAWAEPIAPPAREQFPEED